MTEPKKGSERGRGKESNKSPSSLAAETDEEAGQMAPGPTYTQHDTRNGNVIFSFFLKHTHTHTQIAIIYIEKKERSLLEATVVSV